MSEPETWNGGIRQFLINEQCDPMCCIRGRMNLMLINVSTRKFDHVARLPEAGAAAGRVEAQRRSGCPPLARRSISASSTSQRR
jgi:hypothetical protein